MDSAQAFRAERCEVVHDESGLASGVIALGHSRHDFGLTCELLIISYNHSVILATRRYFFILQ